MADFDGQKNIDPELQEFLMIEKQKAAVAAQVLMFWFSST